MAENEGTESAATETATDSETQTTGNANDLGDAGKKALQEERRKAREATKQLSELQTRLKEFEDRDKTELEKLTEKSTSAEQRAAAAESALMRYRVATEKGVPADLVDRLRGSTEAELTADAEKLLELIGPRSGNSVPSFDGGARTSATAPTDMNQLLRQAAGRQ